MPKTGIAITRFIAADAPSPLRSQLAQIAGTLRRLHDAPLFPPLTDYCDGLGKIMEFTQANALLPPEAKADLARLYQQCAAVYPRAALEIVSSHNDLNPSNWLFAGERLWIVDWESAFAADRYVDLGTVANFLDLDEAASDHWLSLYFRRGSEPTATGSPEPGAADEPSFLYRRAFPSGATAAAPMRVYLMKRCGP